MKAFLKTSYFWVLLCIPLNMTAQDSLSINNLKPLSYKFTLVDGKIQGKGLAFLKAEIAKVQFTLLGDYPDSDHCSELTRALIPILQDQGYRTMALGVGVPSARLLDSLTKEPRKVLPRLKGINSEYSFLENKKSITPFPDMKSLKDAQFIQNAGERFWSIVGFGYESWNALPLWVNTMYNNLPNEKRENHKALFTSCQSFLKRQYQNRNEDLSAFIAAINQSDVVNRFLEVAKTISKNDVYLTAFETSLKRAKMYVDQSYFEKNKLRIKDEKRFLKQELERINFDIHKDKLLVKWDRNFLSRGFQPYAFYGVGNMLSEIADYNGSSSLHIAVIQRYFEESGIVKDVLNPENGNSPVLSSLLEMGQKNEWTIINLQPIRPGHFYAPRKYVLNNAEEDFIKRFDILIIPPIEKEETLLID